MNQATTYKLIESIEDLRLDQFIDCICDQKLNVLVIEGQPSDVDLLECWANLYSQYLDILDDSETLYMLHLERDVELLRYKIVTAEAIVKVLQKTYVGQLVEVLKMLKFSTVGIKQGHSGYNHSLAKVEAKITPLKLKLEQKSGELTEYYKDKGEDKVSRQFFRTQVSRLSKYQGYPLRPAKTLVPEYVAVLRDYLSLTTKNNTDATER